MQEKIHESMRIKLDGLKERAFQSALVQPTRCVGCRTRSTRPEATKINPPSRRALQIETRHASIAANEESTKDKLKRVGSRLLGGSKGKYMHSKWLEKKINA